MKYVMIFFHACVQTTVTPLYLRFFTEYCRIVCRRGKIRNVYETLLLTDKVEKICNEICQKSLSFLTACFSGVQNSA